MKYISFNTTNEFKVCILIKESHFNKNKLIEYYVKPLLDLGIAQEDILLMSLEFDKAKPTASFIHEYIGEIIPTLESIPAIYVADSQYFKTITKVKKADPNFGYALPTHITGLENCNFVLGIDYTQIPYNPAVEAKLYKSLEVIASVAQNKYMPPGSNIIHYEEYPETIEDIKTAIAALHLFPLLSCDIEGFSLNVHTAGIGTIAFAWDEHEGIAFTVDWREHHTASDGLYGYQLINPEVRALLKEFFCTYKGTIAYHGIEYDAKVLAYELFMEDPLDLPNQIFGVQTMTYNAECTKILAYLATNNAIENSLGLKDLAQEYAGNWAESDIKDIRKIPKNKLLKYNLMDALATIYVYKKFKPVVQQEQQSVYETIYLPSIPMLLNVMLNGMPMDDEEIESLDLMLLKIIHEQQEAISANPIIQDFNEVLRIDACEKANSKLKVKKKDIAEFEDVVFNPNSDKQLQKLLFAIHELPIFDLTDTKQPSTGNDTLKKLLVHLEKSYDIKESDYD